MSKANYTVQGSKVFKTVLKSDVSGALEVPGITFSYFDPRSKTYKTITTSPLKVTVRPSETAGESSSGPAPLVPPEGIKVVSQDIRFIKTDTVLKPRRRRGWNRGIQGLERFAGGGLPRSLDRRIPPNPLVPKRQKKSFSKGF